MEKESINPDPNPTTPETGQYAATTELSVHKVNILDSPQIPAESPHGPEPNDHQVPESRDFAVGKAVVLPSAQKPAEPPPKDTKEK